MSSRSLLAALASSLMVAAIPAHAATPTATKAAVGPTLRFSCSLEITNFSSVNGKSSTAYTYWLKTTSRFAATAADNGLITSAPIRLGVVVGKKGLNAANDAAVAAITNSGNGLAMRGTQPNGTLILSGVPVGQFRVPYKPVNGFSSAVGLINQPAGFRGSGTLNCAAVR